MEESPFRTATILPEFYFDAQVLSLPRNAWVAPFLRERQLQCLFEPEDIKYSDRQVQDFYMTLACLEPLPDASNLMQYSVSIDGQQYEFTAADMCQALGFPYPCPDDWVMSPPEDTPLLDIVQEMCGGLHARNPSCTYKALLPPPMLLLDHMVERNLCLIFHKQERRNKFLEVLYCLHINRWFNIGEVMLSSILKVKSRIESGNKRDLYFPRYITQLLVLLGVRVPDRTDMPPFRFFKITSWNRSTSHIKIKEQNVPAHAPTFSSPISDQDLRHTTVGQEYGEVGNEQLIYRGRGRGRDRVPKERRKGLLLVVEGEGGRVCCCWDPGRVKGLLLVVEGEGGRVCCCWDPGRVREREF